MKDNRRSIRIEIRIERSAVRRALVVGGSLVLLAIAGVCFAVPIPNLAFKDGDTLGAKQLNDNFTNIEGRLAALESFQTQATQKGTYSVGAIFCGATAATAGSFSGPGALTGYASAKAQCQAVAGCSPTAAHMCTSEELVRTRQGGTAINTVGWYSSAVRAVDGVTIADCSSWMVAASNQGGAAWDVSGSDEPSAAFCNISHQILCCN